MPVWNQLGYLQTKYHATLHFTGTYTGKDEVISPGFPVLYTIVYYYFRMYLLSDN